MLLELFLTFFRIGAFTFGGGYAMISVIEDICVSRKKWITHEDLVNVTVIAESTPGPVAINCATFVGYKQKGFIGAVMATLGVVLPSFIIIYVISLFIEQFMQLTVIANAFKGIQVAVAFLILRAGLRLVVRMPRRAYSLVACALAGLMILGINLFGWKISTIYLIMAGAAAGILLLRAPAAKGGEAK